ncbi:PaaI family thioesterase [Cupriavidus basilensis]
MAESNQPSGAAGADAADAADAVPPGFKAMRPSGGFLAHLGQLYVDSGQRAVGVRIGKHHLNPLGIPHGGMLATLADTAIGMMMLMEGERMPPAVTAQSQPGLFRCRPPGRVDRGACRVRQNGFAAALRPLPRDGRRALPAARHGHFLGAGAPHLKGGNLRSRDRRHRAIVASDDAGRPAAAPESATG